ncbi:hypothetical protein KKG22_00070 [Patescibacteria group bacterium]|nr:hypothetical protein [Patescibacteria group bacterium]MBU1722073.1 hypothetical protein [Patescibacteria group bacterium]MBU1901353.1 hypothetical protein [Patescibacteria group bacterium]
MNNFFLSIHAITQEMALFLQTSLQSQLMPGFFLGVLFTLLVLLFIASKKRLPRNPSLQEISPASTPQKLQMLFYFTLIAFFILLTAIVIL